MGTLKNIPTLQPGVPNSFIIKKGKFIRQKQVPIVSGYSQIESGKKMKKNLLPGTPMLNKGAPTIVILKIHQEVISPLVEDVISGLSEEKAQEIIDSMPAWGPLDMVEYTKFQKVK